MKTHELISLFDYISKIMSHYPNKSIEYALDDILTLLEVRHGETPTTKKKEKESHIQKNESHPRTIKNDIFQENVFGKNAESDNKSPNETLNNLSLEQLKKIASEIGIKTSSRQNKGILVMNISKTMERRRIDSTIQDKDKNKEE